MASAGYGRRAAFSFIDPAQQACMRQQRFYKLLHVRRDSRASGAHGFVASAVESVTPRAGFQLSLASFNDLVHFGDMHSSVPQQIDTVTASAELACLLECAECTPWLRIASLRLEKDGSGMGGAGHPAERFSLQTRLTRSAP